MSSQLHEYKWATGQLDKHRQWKRIFFLCYHPLDTQSSMHRRCAAQPAVFSHTNFSSLCPHPFLSTHPHSNFSHLFSPEKKNYYSFWPYHSTQISLKSEKQECSTLFEPEDTCSSVSGEQFRANSKKMKMSRTRYFLKTNQTLCWANNRNTICFAFFFLKERPSLQDTSFQVNESLSSSSSLTN